MNIAKALFSVYGHVKKDKSDTCMYEMNLYPRRINMEVSFDEYGKLSWLRSSIYLIYVFQL